MIGDSTRAAQADWLRAVNRASALGEQEADRQAAEFRRNEHTDGGTAACGGDIVLTGGSTGTQPDHAAKAERRRRRVFRVMRLVFLVHIFGAGFVLRGCL